MLMLKMANLKSLVGGTADFWNEYFYDNLNRTYDAASQWDNIMAESKGCQEHKLGKLHDLTGSSFEQGKRCHQPTPAASPCPLLSILCVNF